MSVDHRLVCGKLPLSLFTHHHRGNHAIRDFFKPSFKKSHSLMVCMFGTRHELTMEKITRDSHGPVGTTQLGFKVCQTNLAGTHSI